MIILAPLLGTDITSIWEKEDNDMTVLTGAERNAHDDIFWPLLWDAQLVVTYWGRQATPEERTNLHEC